MSKDAFDADCPGCRPVIVDPDTMKELPQSNPTRRALDRAWAKWPTAGREAFHRVTCQNSRAPEDVASIKAFWEAVVAEASD